MTEVETTNALLTLLSSSPLALALFGLGWLVKRALKPYAEQVKEVIGMFGEFVKTLKSFVESSQQAGEAQAENVEATRENTQALIELKQATQANNPTGEKL